MFFLESMFKDRKSKAFCVPADYLYFPPPPSSTVCDSKGLYHYLKCRILFLARWREMGGKYLVKIGGEGE
jgi:hypothetical protein